jgi:hypothetical protein
VIELTAHCQTEVRRIEDAPNRVVAALRSEQRWSDAILEPLEILGHERFNRAASSPGRESSSVGLTRGAAAMNSTGD